MKTQDHTQLSISPRSGAEQGWHIAPDILLVFPFWANLKPALSRTDTLGRRGHLGGDLTLVYSSKRKPTVG